jgi:hypothetical protein
VTILAKDENLILAKSFKQCEQAEMQLVINGEEYYNLKQNFEKDKDFDLTEDVDEKKCLCLKYVKNNIVKM